MSADSFRPRLSKSKKNLWELAPGCECDRSPLRRESDVLKCLKNACLSDSSQILINFSLQAISGQTLFAICRIKEIELFEGDVPWKLTRVLH